MGFCDMLGAPCGMPFIFANCDGTGSDVTVYTHELGHGLQATSPTAASRWRTMWG